MGGLNLDFFCRVTGGFQQQICLDNPEISVGLKFANVGLPKLLLVGMRVTRIGA